jgi:hypothetical protein
MIRSIDIKPSTVKRKYEVGWLKQQMECDVQRGVQGKRKFKISLFCFLGGTGV